MILFCCICYMSTLGKIVRKKNLSFSRKWGFFSQNEDFFSKRRIICRFEKRILILRKESSFSRKGQILFSGFFAVHFYQLISILYSSFPWINLFPILSSLMCSVNGCTTSTMRVNVFIIFPLFCIHEYIDYLYNLNFKYCV